MKKQFLECGKIVTTHGVKGEVKAEPWCDTPDFLLDFNTLYLDKGTLAINIERIRVHKNMVVLKIEGVDTVEQAVSLRNKVLFINRDDAVLEEGECFVQDLIGAVVIDIDTGRNYGKIYDVRPTGANDVYYLRDEQGKERLVPVIDQVVIEKDIDGGIVKIRPLEGLFDD
ncbi:ribosome maturation factor RimM [Youxingia wuxianensis]|uniref:Ribosome maturation factor RimM n=1 Tax=Youxingia wuxianensis TaxID=2763678 RepID=A0A926IG73_9FIRM|nr:ribosome maturation factor RimM [Youxingia wuxianensis]MBC8584579.1 16S rRNA processing protein RimM [Youxingia wuxianensis]